MGHKFLVQEVEQDGVSALSIYEMEEGALSAPKKLLEYRDVVTSADDPDALQRMRRAIDASGTSFEEVGDRGDLRVWLVRYFSGHIDDAASVMHRTREILNLLDPPTGINWV